MKVTITDTIGTSGFVIVEKEDVTEAITPWYPDAPEEVHAALAELQSTLDRNEDTSELTEYLGITIERA